MRERIDEAFDTLIGAAPYEPQVRIIENSLRGENVFGVLPTGGGKSMCYQVPATIQGGPVLVFSPLIALMKDQVDSCKRMGLKAVRISHDISSTRIQRYYRRLNRHQLVYVAPERLKSTAFLEALRKFPPKLIVVDEAHEHSKSSKDFRPAYALVSDLLERFSETPVMALTATADEEVEIEFANALRGREYVRVVGSPNRPNLAYRTIKNTTPTEVASLLTPIEKSGGASIIYCSTRTLVDNVSTLLSRAGCDVCRYHAGMNSRDRNRSQEDWMEGRHSSVVATNAFGMGVNKANVRLVLHYTQPGSVFQYLQEAGRAGRDGEPSDCVLNMSDDGKRVQNFFIDMQNPPYALYEEIWKYAGENPDKSVSVESIAKDFGIKRGHEGKVFSVLRYMEYCGCVEVTNSVTLYELAIRNRKCAEEFADEYSYVRLRNRLCEVCVPAARFDPVGDMVHSGAVASGLPVRLIKIARLGNEMLVREQDVRAKRTRAEHYLEQVSEFARSEDKEAMIEDIFLSREQEDL